MISFETHKDIQLNNEYVSFKKEDVESTGYYKYCKNKIFKEEKKFNDEKLFKINKIKIEQSTPPSYCNSIEQEQKDMADYFIKSFDHSVLICNIEDIVETIQQFKYRIFELRVPLTKQQYHYLIPRLFELMEKFRAEDAGFFIVNFLALLLTRGKKLIELKINWRPLYKIFKEHCLIAQQYGSFDDFHCPTKVQQAFNVLVYSCQPFLGGDEVVEEILEEIGVYLVPHSNYIYYCVNVFYLFTPTYHLADSDTMPAWIDKYLNFYWNWIDFNRDWDERWLFIFSRAIKFGVNIDWTPILPQIYTKLLKVLDLSSPSMSHLKPVKHKIPEILRLTREERMEFHSIGKIIACLINEKTQTSAIDHFKAFISKINLYFHPSNTGDWTTDLGEMTLSMSKSFLKRNKYIPYSEPIIHQFLDIIYPSLIHTLFSKKKNISLTIAKIMNEFSHIAPLYILPKIIDDFYSSVDREELNRLIGGIEVVSTCLHPILYSPQFPEGKTHLFTFMEIMIKCLDPIYTNKASGAFKFFNKLFGTILMSDENNYIDQCENQIEENVTLSTSLFQDWSITFVDASINFLLQSSTKKGNDKRETVSNVFFNETLALFFSCLSDDIYNAVLGRLSVVFTSVFEPEYYKQLGEFLKSATLRDPVKSISVFLPIFINKLFIKQKVNNNNSKYVISDLSDQEFKLYITFIGYLIFKGGHGLVQFKDTLIDILTVLMESDNKIVIKSTSKVIRKLIFSTTRIYPSNVREVPQSIVDKKENHIKYWGSTNLDTILPIEWFEPNSNDIEFGKLLIEKFLKDLNLKLSKYILQFKNDRNEYNRMKLLNLLKPISSILRAATFLLEDSSVVIEPAKEDFRYPTKKFRYEHGQIFFKEFSTLKQDIFNNFKQTIQFIESENNNEEIQALRIISKSLLIMFYCKGDIVDRTNDHLFEKWKNHKKLKGRNYLIFKAFRNHLIRQKLYFQQLDLTQLTLDALYCCLNLAVHNYRRVREAAQKSMVNILHCFPASYKIVLPSCLDRLSELKNDSEIKGISFLFQAKSIARRLKGNPEYIKRLQPIIALPLDQKFKPNTRSTFSEVKKVLLLAKSLPVMFYYQSKEMEIIENRSGQDDAAAIPDHIKQLLSKAIKYNHEKVESNRSNIITSLEGMVSLTKAHDKKEILPWRNHLFLLSSIIYYFSVLFNPPPSLKDGFDYKNNFKDQEGTIKEFVSCLAKNSICDYPFSRIYCLNLISNILSKETSKNIEFRFHQYFGDDRFEKHYQDDLVLFERSILFEKYLMDLCGKEIVSILFGDSTINNNNNNNQMIINDGVSSNSNASDTITSTDTNNDGNIISSSSTPASKLFAYMSQDHEGEGSANGFCQSITNKNFSCTYPNTRASISNKDFRTFNAKFFFGLFQSIGTPFLEQIKPTMEKLKGKTDKEDFFLLVEMIAGISRYISINDDLLGTPTQRDEIFQFIHSIAFVSLTTCPNECTEAWECAIRYISHNIKYEKIEWFSQLLFAVHKKTNNILSGSKSIRFLKTLVVEVTWKSKDLSQKLMEIAKTEFSNNYKQIRTEAMRLFALLLIYQTDFSVYPSVIPSNELSILQSFIEAITSNSPSNSGSNSPSLIQQQSNGSTGNLSTDIQMNEQPPTQQQANGALSPTTTTPLNTSNSAATSTKNAIKENIMLLIFFLNSKNSILIRSTPILLKAVMGLSADTNLEISKDTSVCIYRMSQEFYLDSGVIDQLISSLNQTIQSPSWKVRISVLQFIQIFFFNHSFYFSNQQMDSIVNIVLNLTKDPQIEIRENSKITLASILISFKPDSNRIKDLIKRAIKNLNIPNQTFIEKHSSIIILSSIVLASPYDIPKYIPEALEQLSKYSRNSQYKTAASSISEFWRTHKDSWDEDKRQFTEEEAEAILSTKVAPSYFA